MEVIYDVDLLVHLAAMRQEEEMIEDKRRLRQEKFEEIMRGER